jgi:hypothetical protein
MTQQAIDLLEWRHWIGLPHEIGADPREGRAACCVRMAQILLRNAGLPAPDLEPEWFTHAAEGRWDYCRSIFHDLTEPTPERELWTMAWVTNGPKGFGIGTVVQGDRLLIPHHRKGVFAIPISLLKPLSYFRVKQ